MKNNLAAHQAHNISQGSQGSQPNQSNVNNTSQYVSNFQSIIHDDNGLYRKIKSSQVSLQGFKVIDHKFHGDYYLSPTK